MGNNSSAITFPISTTAGPDIVFLLFLLLVTQGSIPVKLLGLAFIVIMRPGAILRSSLLANFYILIILFHIVYGAILLFIDTLDYLPTYITVLSFWMISYIIYAVSEQFIRNNNLQAIKRTINIYFLLCIGTMLFQYFLAVMQYNHPNPYMVSPAAGDLMRSLFSNSSVNMIILSFFFIYYLMEAKWFYMAAALAGLLMTTYMSGIVILGISLITGIMIYSKIKLTHKVYMVVLSVAFAGLFLAVSPDNVNYAMGYIKRIWEFEEDTLPFKVKSIQQTIEYFFGSLQAFLFGAGGGNFSSRVAFIFSGDYVPWLPATMEYISDEFSSNHFGIWTYDFNNPWDNRNNTANQPFAFYNKIIGEYGMMGVLLYAGFYLNKIFVYWGSLKYTKYTLLALGGYFFLDYWFEYFSVVVIFELLFLTEIKMTEAFASDKHIE